MATFGLMPAPPVIAVEQLTVTPPDADAPVLRDVRLAVHAGDRVVLTGPSGSGKTTLLRAMVMLEPADGRILLDGDEVTPERVRELRRRVGYLPQRPVSIAETVESNLSFPREIHPDALDEEEQRLLLDRLGLGTTDLSRRFGALSGGEQQRVALVRSLTPRPTVLLLDEPTASLDPENVEVVVALLAEWSAAAPGRALVWVSHHAAEVEALATRRATVGELAQ